MLNVTNLLCDHRLSNDLRRYQHEQRDAYSDPFHGAPRPAVSWAVTRACNLRCATCYSSSEGHPEPGELTYGEGIALLKDLKTFGVPMVNFTGGEPLIRPDTPKLLEYARSLGLECTLSTNGTLIDPAMADRLARLGLNHVAISLDGTEERHDKARGTRGAFRSALAAIDRCRGRGLRVGVNFTVQASNRSDLDEIFDLCIEHDVQRLCIHHRVYAGREGKQQGADLSASETRSIIDYVFARARMDYAAGFPLEVFTVDNHTDASYLMLFLERTEPARAALVAELLRSNGGNRSGCHVASIDSTGHVHYDAFSWHYTCGTIREMPFSRIWSDAADRRLAILRERKPHLPLRCQQCRFVEVCNGNLRTRAEVVTGNWLAADPGCYLSDEEIGLPRRMAAPLPVRTAKPI